MAERTIWETIEFKGGQIVDKLKEIVEAGNVRRVRIRNKNGTIAEFPLTAGVVGAVIAPVAAAIGVIIALIKDCSIDIERAAPETADATAPVATSDTAPPA